MAENTTNTNLKPLEFSDEQEIATALNASDVKIEGDKVMAPIGRVDRTAGGRGGRFHPNDFGMRAAPGRQSQGPGLAVKVERDEFSGGPAAAPVSGAHPEGFTTVGEVLRSCDDWYGRLAGAALRQYVEHPLEDTHPALVEELVAQGLIERQAIAELGQPDPRRVRAWGHRGAGSSIPL